MDSTLQTMRRLFTRTASQRSTTAPPSQPEDVAQSPVGLRRNPSRSARRAPILYIDEEDSEEDSEEVEKLAKARYEKRPLRSPGPFRFLDLPAELRNMVYEYLLVNNHCRNDPVFSIPAIKKMIQKREAIKRRRQAMLEKRLARRMKPVQHRVTATIPLVYTSIYSTCKQIHDEAKDVFFRMNSFHIVIPDFDFIYRRDDMLFLKGLDDSWDFPRITNLQLELCISSIFNLKTRVNWVDLTKNLPYLRKLQVFVTSSNFSRFKTTELYDWERVNWKYKAAFRDLVAAIPKSVDVKWGLTLKQKLGNFKGKDYLEGKVLRAMYRQYENQRGIDYEVPDTMAVDEDDTESVVDPYAGYSSMFDDD